MILRSDTAPRELQFCENVPVALTEVIYFGVRTGGAHKSTPFGFSSPRLAEANFPFRKVPTMLAAHFWIALSASAMPFRSLKTSPSGSPSNALRREVTWCSQNRAGVSVQFGSPAVHDPTAALHASVRRHRRRMMSHAKSERSSSRQSTSGTGSGARPRGLLIKPAFVLLPVRFRADGAFLSFGKKKLGNKIKVNVRVASTGFFPHAAWGGGLSRCGDATAGGDGWWPQDRGFSSVAVRAALTGSGDCFRHGTGHGDYDA